MATDGKFASSKTDASDAIHDFSCNPCSKYGKNTEALFQCFDCQIYLCQRCVTGHNKFTVNHNVFDKASKLFGRGQRQPLSSSSNELPADLCEEHQGEVIKMFCRQQDLVCCTVCIAVKHRSCEGVEFIPSIAKGLLKTQDKDKTQTSLEEVKYDLQNLKSKMQNELKELNKQRDGILDDIKDYKQHIIERVEVLEKKTTQKVKAKHKEIADDITASSKKIDDMLKDVELQLDKLGHLKGNNEAQLFVDIKYGAKIISEGNDCVRQPATKYVSTLDFEVNRSIEMCLHEVQFFGKLTVRTIEDVAGN